MFSVTLKYIFVSLRITASDVRLNSSSQVYSLIYFDLMNIFYINTLAKLHYWQHSGGL